MSDISQLINALNTLNWPGAIAFSSIVVAITIVLKTIFGRL